jgi:hypothetical protein
MSVPGVHRQSWRWLEPNPKRGGPALEKQSCVNPGPVHGFAAIFQEGAVKKSIVNLTNSSGFSE